MNEPTTPEDFARAEGFARLLSPSPSPYSPAAALARDHPSGWEPGVVWDGKKGTVTSRPTGSATPQWELLLKSWGFDPELYEIEEPVQIRTWDGFGKNAEGELATIQLWYHRANIRSRVPVTDRADIEALVQEIRKHKPVPRVATDVQRSLVVCCSDWQAGKDEGGGSAALVLRVLDKIDAVSARLRELRRSGRPVSQMHVVGMGDLVEGCSEFYAQQTFRVDLDRRDQVKLVRRLLTKAITTWAPLVERMVVAAVPGNHGENRKDGRAYTTFGDNDDVAVVEQVAEIIGSNPTYEHVAFIIPTDQLAITLDVCGTVVAFAHGHQARSGVNAQAKVKTWWSGQTFGGQPAGDAAILVTGHYHHLSVVDHGPRVHIQCPALDGGSSWFGATRGEVASTGMLTFTVDATGWDDLRVL